MPVWIVSLVGALIEVAGSLAGRALIALGITIATTVGIGSSLDWAVAYVGSHWDSLPPAAYQILSALRVGQDIGILVGAVTAKLTLKGLQNNAMSFWQMRGGVPKV